MIHRRPFVVLTLTLALTGTSLAASASPRAPQRAPDWEAPAVSRLLSGLWQHLTALWGAAGCGADPSGVKCQAGTNGVVTPVEEGCGADPSGARCQAGAVTPVPAGCGLDPSGLCER
jgi:hypothetical protein